MKRLLVSLLRLGVVVGALIVLQATGDRSRAQVLMTSCGTWNSEPVECPLNCTKTDPVGGAEAPTSALTETSSTGTQSLFDASWSCGTATATGTTCSGTVPMAMSSSNCCIADGQPSASNEPCCTGLIARSNGECGFCSDEGESCGSDSDCCTQGDTCTAGVCAAPIHCFNNPSCTGGSPIILDISGKGFHLTSAEDGVSFDIAGVGSPIQIGWTAKEADNAFLALPAADGLIHSGKQLFGNFTPQPPSPDPNGFLALAVYDKPAIGGNGDGIIDSRDAIYSHLRLWIDANHDGISQPEELHSLSSLGVLSLSLHDTLSRRVDQYGNLFRYKAAVDPNDPDPAHVGRVAYDVFFVTQNSSTTQ